MRKWFTRLTALLALLATGYLVVALQPAWKADTMQHSGALVLELSHAPQYPVDIHYTWNIEKSPARTVFIGQEEVFRQLQSAAEWTLHFRSEGDKLYITTEAPLLHAENKLCHIDTRYNIYDMGCTQLRMPDGSSQSQQHLMLVWKMVRSTSFQRDCTECLAVQEIVLDVQDGAADLVVPTLPKEVIKNRKVRHVVAGAPSGLPERFCGTAGEQALLRFLFRMAAICDEQSARILAPELRRKGHEMLDAFAIPSLPWPECWGNAAPTARLIARRVIPLLQEWQSHGCYGEPELADFVNGPVFGRIFGENFTHATE